MTTTTEHDPRKRIFSLGDDRGAMSEPVREPAPGAMRHDDGPRTREGGLGEAQAVQAVRYVRERHGAWTIEHGRAGDDYFLHLHPMKSAARSEESLLTA